GPGGAYRGRGMMGLRRLAPARLEGPRLDAAAGRRVVTMVYGVLGENDQPAGRVELDMAFDFFLEGLQALSWWRTTQVMLVNQAGDILASHGYDPPRQGRLGGDGDALAQAVLADMGREDAGTRLSGHPARRVMGFHRLARAPWVLVLSAAGDRVLAPVFSFLASYAAAVVIAVVMVSLLILAVTGGVARRVATISRATDRVAEGDYAELEPESCCDEVGQLAQGFNQMVAGLKERDFIRDTFGRYVDEGVAKKLMARPDACRLGGDLRVVAILMTDVRGFTPVSAALGPERTIQLVNRYLEGIIDAISDHQGIIVDFLGDGALAFFDSLDATPQEAARLALCCAMAVRKANDAFNRRAEAEGLPRLDTAIALNAGPVVVGNIGSRARTKFGIVGGPVNLTQRIQTQAEGGEVVASCDFVALCRDYAQVQRRFVASLKGVAEPVELCVLQADERCARLARGEEKAEPA
ncbi:MAG: adenylate/guanylate cyclase domain-containing protein, partial [Pseudomonadota bacterium]